ncbi:MULTISPECIES: DUF6062 family protein [Thermoanaerobacter]|nr:MULTISPECIES: DUF6062 family protein [Thermoanaerobacter]ADV79240.1 hypothetical protein Thebr_0642 [Thermoanaerobacter brockii subsp. finnii Ako-1]HBW60502.1 hypothetical protein [Thermoanaerobacter sp.]
MKLEFIPLYEVFEKYKGGCPICKVIKDEEKAYCEHLFEDEVLKDPEMYVKIRETNFCHYHLELLNNSYDKLGLAIALKENVTYKLQQITEKGKSLKKKRKKETKNKCLVCDYLSERDKYQMHILIDILHADKEFVEKHSEGLSKLCFHHLNMFMEAKKDVTPQIEKIFKINKAAIEKNINDLEWFITKFDYRFHDEPWYDSKDSIERALKLLRGGYYD